MSEALIPKIDPNYYVRDKDIYAQLSKDIEKNKRVMLTGHTGTGKSSTLQNIAANKKQPMIRVNADGHITSADFVGYMGVSKKETTWVDGILPLAVRNGYWLLIDEIDFAEANILSVLNYILEENGKLILKEKGHEVIEPHPNFRLMATANTAGCMSYARHLYQGTNILNEAFLDRWNVYYIDYLSPEEETKIILSRFKPLFEKVNAKYAANVEKKGIPIEQAMLHVTESFTDAASRIRDAFKSQKIESTFSTRKLLNWVEKFLECAAEGMPILECKRISTEITIYSKVSAEDRQKIENLLKRLENNGQAAVEQD